MRVIVVESVRSVVILNNHVDRVKQQRTNVHSTRQVGESPSQKVEDQKTDQVLHQGSSDLILQLEVRG